jgi:pyruvate oxidase
MSDESTNLVWHKVAEPDELPDGRVKTVTAGARTLALTHFDGRFAAMDNHCPHQGGPLGEGSIETGANGKCWLRCPWHGWDFDPLTGRPPGGHKDSGQEIFDLEVRDDGIYVGVPPEPEHALTVTDIMAQTMVAWGVKSVFGIVGHSNLGLADALRRRAVDGELTYFGVRHEGAASFACSGYAKLTDHPAACLTIAGPGATNLITGLWDAKVDRAPVLALTGQVHVQVLGPGAFQDIDLSSAFEAVAHFSQPVLHHSNHAELMALAIKSALNHRDVSHLIFPDNVQTVPAKEGARPKGPRGRLSATARIGPPEDAVEEALAALSAAKRPIVIAGYGARGAMPEIVALAEALKAPVLTTFKAKGQIGDDHPNSAGVLGRSGTPIASWFMNESDLILAFGASFSNHTGIASAKDIVQIDFDQAQLARFHPVKVPVWGDCGRTADIFCDRLPDRSAFTDQVPELAERWHMWRAEKNLRLTEDNGLGISSIAVFDALTRLAPPDAIFAVDVGNNTYSFGRYYEPSGDHRVLMSGYLGSIGFAFPAAMGAWAATQDFDAYRGRKVISVSGDGGFGQYAMEFTTAVKYGMDITHILLNNSEFGKISKEQRAGHWPVWQTDLRNPNFAGFARSCGGHGQRVKERGDLDKAIIDALAIKGPALVEIITDPELV